MKEQYARPVAKLRHILRISVNHYYLKHENSTDHELQSQWALKISGKLLVNHENVIKLLYALLITIYTLK